MLGIIQWITLEQKYIEVPRVIFAYFYIFCIFLHMFTYFLYIFLSVFGSAVVGGVGCTGSHDSNTSSMSIRSSVFLKKCLKKTSPLRGEKV